MEHRDQEITDVIVVLDCEDEQSRADVTAALEALGLTVSESRADTDTIEGSIDAAQVHELSKVPCVRYVRSVFTYTADYPTGDPRDQDGAEDDDGSDRED